MDIMMSIHKEWVDKILSGKKPFEFRKKLPKNFSAGDKIYIYETSKQNGLQKVIGECKVKHILNFANDKGKLPCFGCYPFIEYFMEHIKGDKETADRFKSVKEEFYGKFERYKYGFIINFALCDLELEHIRQHGCPIDTWELYPYAENEELKTVLEQNEKANKLLMECDAWLSEIGFYDDTDESFWRYAIELTDIVKYDKPMEIQNFIGKNNKPIRKPPQSWYYVK